MASTTAQKTISVLKAMFAAYGLPEQIVTDNGPQFVPEKFAMFMRGNGIKHIRSTPTTLQQMGLWRDLSRH